jgi:hypothetical protein
LREVGESVEKVAHSWFLEIVMPDSIRHPCWRAQVDPGSSLS